MIATEANVPLKKVTRYDLNIASGIIHSVKENEITSIITGLHRKKTSQIHTLEYLPNTY